MPTGDPRRGPECRGRDTAPPDRVVDCEDPRDPRAPASQLQRRRPDSPVPARDSPRTSVASSDTVQRHAIRDIADRAAGHSRPRSRLRQKPHGGRLRVALAFPNTYFVGMSNLGLPDGLPPLQRRWTTSCASGCSCRRSRSSPAARPAIAAPDAGVADARSPTSTCSPSRCRSSGTTRTSSRCCAWRACPLRAAERDAGIRSS